MQIAAYDKASKSFCLNSRRNVFLRLLVCYTSHPPRHAYHGERRTVATHLLVGETVAPRKEELAARLEL